MNAVMHSTTRNPVVRAIAVTTALAALVGAVSGSAAGLVFYALSGQIEVDE